MNFWLTVLINLGLHIRQLLPALILFILHFLIGLPLWVAAVAVIVWLFYHIFMTGFLSWIASQPGSQKKGNNVTHYASQSNHSWKESGNTSGKNSHKKNS